MAHVSTRGAGARHGCERGAGAPRSRAQTPSSRRLCASAGGAGVRAGALPSRPAHRPHAAARLPPALCPRRSRPHRPRPPAALPALSGAAEARRSLDRAHRCGARCSASPRLRSGPGDKRPPSSDAASCRARGTWRGGDGGGWTLAGAGAVFLPENHWEPSGGVAGCLFGAQGSGPGWQGTASSVLVLCTAGTRWLWYVGIKVVFHTAGCSVGLGPCQQHRGVPGRGGCRRPGELSQAEPRAAGQRELSTLLGATLAQRPSCPLVLASWWGCRQRQGARELLLQRGTVSQKHSLPVPQFPLATGEEGGIVAHPGGDVPNRLGMVQGHGAARGSGAQRGSSTLRGFSTLRGSSTTPGQGAAGEPRCRTAPSCTLQPPHPASITRGSPGSSVRAG